MSTSVELRSSSGVWIPAETQPLDEAVWKAWILKGRVSEARSSATRLRTVKLVSAAALLATAALWSYLGPYDVLVRFVVALGATVVMFQSFQARQFAVGTVFAALVLIYNPVAPAFAFVGDWQRIFALASAVPFIVPPGWGGSPASK